MKKNLLNLKIAVVALGLFISATANASFTAVMSGNWSSAATWGGTAPSSTVTAQDITIPTGITVTLDADVTFSGVLNHLIVDGTLTSTTTNSIIMLQGDLKGGGTISVNSISFMLLGTSSFSGNLTLKHMANSATSLAFVAIANISDTLYLESGNLLLNTNSNLTMLANSTVKVKDGALTLGAGVFNSGNAYNVMYVGNTKTAGIELNSATLQHFYLNMNGSNQNVTLANNTTVNGTMNLSTGKLVLNGKKLTLKGDFMASSNGSLSSSSSSDLEVQGTGTMTSALMFDAGSSVNDLTINRTTNGQVKIGNSVNVSNHLNLMDGNLSIENASTLTLNAGSLIHVEKGNLSVNSGTFMGTSSYNVEYMGSTGVTTGVELSGSGLDHITVNYLTSSNKVILNSNTTVNGNLIMMKGMFDLNGKNLTLNGTISQNSNAAFIGNPSSELNLNLTSVTNDTLFFDGSNANNQTLSKLKINNTGTTSIVLGSKLIIGNELAFIKGKIELTNGDLTISPSGSISGYDDTKYVVTSTNGSGSLGMTVIAGTSHFTFPIGLSANYSPVYVQQTATATTGNFTARCTDMATLTTVKIVNRVWYVESSVASIDANIKFGWKAAAEVNGFDRTNAYVSHYTSSVWDVTAAGSATASVYSTYELSRTGLTSLSPFAVTENGQPLKVGEIAELTGVQVYPNPSADMLNIKVLNSPSDYKYELTDLTGRTIMTTSNNNDVNKFDVSSLSTGCYFIKITNTSNNKTTTQRFIKN